MFPEWTIFTKLPAKEAVSAISSGTWHTGIEVGNAIIHSLPLAAYVAIFLGADYAIGKIIEQPVFDYKFGTISGAAIEKVNSAVDFAKTTHKKFKVIKKVFSVAKKAKAAKQKIKPLGAYLKEKYEKLNKYLSKKSSYQS